MTEPMKCVLCGIHPIYCPEEEGNRFCVPCFDQWRVSLEYQQWQIYNDQWEELVQVFVERTRRDTCKWYDKEASECGDSSQDCFGCPTYAKDAPRPARYDKCDDCIHHDAGNSSIHKECYRKPDGSLSNYVPRACGNCRFNSQANDECLHKPTDCDKGVFQYWQPRPSEQSKETFFPCAKCHGDSRQYQKINKHNGEYCCVKCFKEWEDMDLAMFKTPVRNKLSLGAWVDSFDMKPFTFQCGQSVLCGYNECPQPDCGKVDFDLRRRNECAICGKRTAFEEGAIATCSNHFAQFNATDFGRFEWKGGWTFYHWAAEMKAQLSESKQTCGACDKVKVKICDVCEGRGIIPSYYPGEPPEDCPKCYPKEPAAAPVIKQNEVKNVTDIIRYCEKCGEEIPSVLEMKQKLDNAYRERDLLIEAKNETELIRQRLERAKGDLAAQRDEYVEQIHIRDAELSKVTTELKQVSTDRYAEACRADALQQKLARRGIPFTVRRMMKQLYAHGNFNGVDCCGIFDQVGTHGRVKCNECGAEFTPKEIKRLSKVVPPAKPAPLKQLQKEIRRRKEREYKERHKIFDRIEETRNIIGGVIEFGGFRNEHSSGLYYYGAKVLDLCGSIENEQLWKEHKAKILPALEQYLQEKLKEAPQ